MKPSDMVQLLTWAVTANNSLPGEEKIAVLIKGAPGIGKTDIVKQVAAATGHKLITSHPSVNDPTDIKGYIFPAVDNKSAEFLPTGEIYDVLRADKPTIWFIDDFGQAPQSVQVAYMQWLHARHLNTHFIPDCVTIILATNRVSDKAAVNPIPEPVKSRMCIVDLDFDGNDFQQWMLSQSNIHPYFLSFYRFKPQIFEKYTPTKEMINQPTPRTYAKAAYAYMNKVPVEVLFPVLAGYIGDGAATELKAHLTMAEQLPDITQIFMSPDKTKVPSELSAVYSLSSALAYHVEESSFEPALVYMSRLKDSQGNKMNEFGAMMVKDLLVRKPNMAKTKTFIKWANDPDNMKLLSI